MDATVPIPVPKRAAELVVGDRILPDLLPAVASEPGEVRDVELYTYVGTKWVYVSYRLSSGLIEATHYLPYAQLLVYPADTGQLYSRPADDPQPSAGREPMHTGGMTEGGLVDETVAGVHEAGCDPEHCVVHGPRVVGDVFEVDPAVRDL